MGGMSAPAFDTLKAAKQLGAAGFDDAQAEAVIATVAGSSGQDVGVLKADVGVLKADVRVLKADVQELRKDVQALELRVAGKFEALYKHLWFMGAGVVAANAAVVTVLITLLT